MIAVLLFILKIIGIVLLSLLIILLLLISLVLFVPIHYRLNAEKSTTLRADSKISWLLHILSIHVQYEKELLLKVRVFGFKIYDNKKSKKVKKQRVRNEKKENQKTTQIEEDTKKYAEKNLQIPRMEETPKPEETPDEKKPQEPKPDFLKKCQLFFQKILDVFKNLKYTIKQLYDKILQTLQNIEYYIEICQREETKKAFALCRDSFLKIINLIKPKKFQMYLHIGTNDPAATGQILVWYSMLYPFIGKNIKIEPEFEQFVLEGNVTASGKIRIIVLIRIAWKLFFDKNIRKVIVLFRKEEK